MVFSQIDALSDQYEKLILLVGGLGSGKTATLSKVADFCGIEVTSLGVELSRRLLAHSTHQRPLRSPGLFHEIVDASGAVAILDNLEILFERSLKLDPVHLLRSSARNRVIIASWPGEYSDGVLTHARFGHPEHYIASHRGVCIHASDHANS